MPSNKICGLCVCPYLFLHNVLTENCYYNKVQNLKSFCSELLHDLLLMTCQAKSNFNGM